MVNEDYRERFFSAPVCVMCGEVRDGSVLAEGLRKVGFSSVDVVHVSVEPYAPDLEIYHCGDLISGRRIGEFIEYSREYRAA